MKTASTGLVLTLALAVGCTPSSGLNEARHATGTSTVVASSDYSAAYAVNTNAGTVTRVAPSGSVDNELPVGLEPTRIARAGDRVFVTLRGERAVAVLQETPSGLVEEATIQVGAEPYGIVANEAGTRVYVANSMSDSVSEIDAKSNEVLRTWKVGDEPRYLALHPSEKVLFVGSGRAEADLAQIDLTADSEENPVSPVAVPGVVRFDEDFDSMGELETITLTARITGDMAISPDGSELVVPVLYVDNITPVEDPQVVDGEPVEPVDGGYGGVSEGISRFNPGVAVIPLDTSGEPDLEAAQPIFVSGFRDEFLEFDFIRVRSYPSSVAISPDGLSYLVTMQGSDAVAVVGALPFENSDMRGGMDIGAPMPMDPDEFGEGESFIFTSIRDAGFAERPKNLVWTKDSAGPDGVVFLDKGDAFVHSGFDHNVANLDFDNAFSKVIENGKDGFDVHIGTTQTLSASARLTSFELPADVDEGRRLFFSATAPGMVASGAGVSCASCHFEGRNDGLTWTFDSGVRQTPTLAGVVSNTAPVTWTSDVESVGHEARITTEARMGGEGLSDDQILAIEAFVDFTRIPDTDASRFTAEQIARGQALFERQDVACASCHTGAALTDNAHHTMFGLESVNTPTLLGIAASGPYLHDGRAATLRDVLEWSRNGEMGDTSMLSEAEMTDLEAFLTTL